MSIASQDILFSYQWGAETMQKLVSDVDDEQFASQPIDTINHPAWLFGHLSIYNDIIAALLCGKPFDNPWDLPCGKKSQPTSDRSAYPSKEEILSRFAVGVTNACDAIGAAPPDAWSAALEHDTWGKQFETTSSAVIFLATTHLALHLGQLSGWRRAMKLPRI
ncbi:MAG: DinB family protein [Pirellulales bacterium]|nr:DinB family protein [Pirellulales bacterium]